MIVRLIQRIFEKLAAIVTLQTERDFTRISYAKDNTILSVAIREIDSRNSNWRKMYVCILSYLIWNCAWNLFAGYNLYIYTRVVVVDVFTTLLKKYDTHFPVTHLAYWFGCYYWNRFISRRFIIIAAIRFQINLYKSRTITHGNDSLGKWCIVYIEWINYLNFC